MLEVFAKIFARARVDDREGRGDRDSRRRAHGARRADGDLSKLGIDLVILARYMQVLSGKFTARWRA